MASCLFGFVQLFTGAVGPGTPPPTSLSAFRLVLRVVSEFHNRRLGVKPGNLNGSCVRDPVAGDYFAISPPGARARACPWGWCLTLCCNFEICVAILRFVRLCGSFEDAARVRDVFLSHLKCSGASWV